MKKAIYAALATLICLIPLHGAQVPPFENPDTESPPDLSSPVYATPDAPFRDRTEKEGLSTTKKTLFAVIGTAVTITLGLLVSGADTGKHPKPKESTK